MFDFRNVYVLSLKTGRPKNVLCRWIFKLISFLNRDSTVLPLKYQRFQSCVWYQNKNNFWDTSLDFQGHVLLFIRTWPLQPFCLLFCGIIICSWFDYWLFNKNSVHYEPSIPDVIRKKTLNRPPTPSVGAFHIEKIIDCP